MDTINKLLDTARKACSRDSDNSVALSLGVSRNSVSVWRKGGKITDTHLMALIELAQADPALAVKVRQEEAASPAEKKAWSALWDRLSPVTTVIGALALVAVGMHAGAHEALLAALSPVVITDPLYIMRNVLECGMNSDVAGLEPGSSAQVEVSARLIVQGQRLN
ncbi:DUF3693 domain-containing protein [Xanthomonas cassavae CFBP 4642]|uniref:DUF3693 domain-containing protein n=1 Tax=Xanthomonas cassavae CFBP 4642 TaxID=1219375 RepID=A0ABS8HH91_9XANT|nr:DUF3693 domain-containing protein [Xanthomonas cassavae]MCC4621529.1 DUF3693 domain-containing protein [Xanthomonas cassavae CFBP 4642]